MQPLLSILIPTLESRADKFNSLMENLNFQIKMLQAESSVEVLSICDNKQVSVGFKRNKLIEMSEGKYVCFIDDDDAIAPNYVQLILNAITNNPDVVTFCGRYFVEGKFDRDFTISLYVTHEDTATHLYRKPHHLCPVKRYIALDCPYPNISNGEDYAYSLLLNKYLLTEYHIKDQIYDYLFSPTHTETQK